MNETPAARFTAADLPTLSQLQMLQNEEKRGREQPKERQEDRQQNKAAAPRVFFYADAPSSEQLRTIQQELGGTAGSAAVSQPASPEPLKVLQRNARTDERRAREERDRRERDRIARLAAEQAERERVEQEKARLAAEQAERERIEREKARLAAKQAEREHKAQEEKARIAAEQAERERIEREIARPRSPGSTTPSRNTSRAKRRWPPCSPDIRK